MTCRAVRRSRLFEGMYWKRSRIAWRQASSESCAKCATPDVPACTSAPPSCVHRDFLVRDGLHDVRARHEHVRRAPDHVHEISDRRRIDGPAGAGTQDRRDLRNDARRERVAEEHVGVPAEGDDALLDARAAGVVEPDDRRAVAHREVHHLADLLGVRLGERTAEHREVLREHVDQTSLDAPATR